MQFPKLASTILKGVWSEYKFTLTGWRGQNCHDLVKRQRDQQQNGDTNEKDNSSCTYRFWGLTTNGERRKQPTRLHPQRTFSLEVS